MAATVLRSGPNEGPTIVNVNMVIDAQICVFAMNILYRDLSKVIGLHAKLAKAKQAVNDSRNVTTYNSSSRSGRRESCNCSKSRGELHDV